MSGEIATLVTRHGGVPLSAPALRERRSDEDLAIVLDRLASHRYDLVIVLTGAGATSLLGEAERIGRLAETIGALQRVAVACRGPKPMAALRRHGVAATLVTEAPHTSDELMHVLQSVELRNRAVLLVHYGEPNAAVPAVLRCWGARVDEICPYVWALPEDVAPIAALVRAIGSGGVDAVLFTSQVQARHLFEIASHEGLADDLKSGLNTAVVVAAIGPVCAAALRQLGVRCDVMPGRPNMPALVAAVADYFELVS